MPKVQFVNIGSDVLEELNERKGAKKKILDKETRIYLEVGNQEKNWYLPLKANLKWEIREAFFPTPRYKENEHLVRPGILFRSAIYLPRSQTIEISENESIKDSEYIIKNYDKIKEAFYHYVRSYEYTGPIEKVGSAIEMFPDGVEVIRKPNIVSYASDIKSLIRGANMKEIEKCYKNRALEFLKEKEFIQCLNFFAYHPYRLLEDIELILAQKPDAQYTYSYRVWEKLNREVKDTPEVLYHMKEVFLTEKHEKRETKLKKTDYCLHPVFDVSELINDQTIPRPDYYLSEEFIEPSHYERLFKSLCQLKVCEIKECVMEADYYFIPPNFIKYKHEIDIRKEMDHKRKLSILTYLIVHAKRRTIPGGTEKITQQLKSEMIGYILAKRIGLDTDIYSFKTLESFGKKTREPEAVRKFLETTFTEAKGIIKFLEKKIKEVEIQQKTPKEMGQADRGRESKIERQDQVEQPKEGHSVAKNELRRISDCKNSKQEQSDVGGSSFQTSGTRPKDRSIKTDLVLQQKSSSTKSKNKKKGVHFER